MALLHLCPAAACDADSNLTISLELHAFRWSQSWALVRLLLVDILPLITSDSFFDCHAPAFSTLTCQNTLFRLSQPARVTQSFLLRLPQVRRPRPHVTDLSSGRYKRSSTVPQTILLTSLHSSLPWIPWKASMQQYSLRTVFCFLLRFLYADTASV
ncbi:hypothetical protein IWX90DRAFT_284052 [Phyllosticta citrichinensis]|uniref:Uncharacterized protein n=1 Tax=Phyllosticta citrichinensis TaxID=1130410 RepID=A0ABR1XNW8_9PEZI